MASRLDFRLQWLQFILLFDLAKIVKLMKKTLKTPQKVFPRKFGGLTGRLGDLMKNLETSRKTGRVGRSASINYLWLGMARMEMDCNLKNLANFFKFLLCIVEKSSKTAYSLFFPRYFLPGALTAISC